MVLIGPQRGQSELGRAQSGESALSILSASLPDQTIMDGLWCRGAANIEEEMRMEMVTRQGDFQVHPLQGGPFGSQECIMEIPSV